MKRVYFLSVLALISLALLLKPPVFSEHFQSYNLFILEGEFKENTIKKLKERGELLSFFKLKSFENRVEILTLDENLDLYLKPCRIEVWVEIPANLTNLTKISLGKDYRIETNESGVFLEREDLKKGVEREGIRILLEGDWIKFKVMDNKDIKAYGIKNLIWDEAENAYFFSVQTEIEDRVDEKLKKVLANSKVVFEFGAAFMKANLSLVIDGEVEGKIKIPRIYSITKLTVLDLGGYESSKTKAKNKLEELEFCLRFGELENFFVKKEKTEKKSNLHLLLLFITFLLPFFFLFQKNTSIFFQSISTLIFLLLFISLIQIFGKAWAIGIQTLIGFLTLSFSFLAFKRLRKFEIYLLIVYFILFFTPLKYLALTLFFGSLFRKFLVWIV